MFEHKPSYLKRIILLTLIGSIFAGGITGGIVGLYVAANATGAAIRVPTFLRPTANTQTIQKEVVEESLAAMVKKVGPSVVSIVITKEVSTNSGNFFNFGPFGFDFGGDGGPASGGAGKTEKRAVGGGSGFIVSADGLIVTNRHVVADTDATYTVVRSDGTKHDATVLARDTVIDLALIKIEGSGLPTLTLGDSDKLELGQTVVAIGNALGEFNNSVTRGIVSGINRRIVAGGGTIGSEVIEEAIQTDAAINPGNSGGPLLTLDGTVVGVNTAVSQQGQSLGFAIPVNVAKQSIESVKKHGRIIRPFLGVRYTIITPDLAQKNQLPVQYGALVSRGTEPGQLAVIPGSPADKAGIVENDIILEADGQKIDADHSLVGVINKHKVGDAVVCKVYHKGDTKTVTVTLAELPKQ